MPLEVAIMSSLVKGLSVWVVGAPHPVAYAVLGAFMLKENDETNPIGLVWKK